MMAANDDLTQLHNRWLFQFDQMVKQDGVDADNAAESMLTISVTGLMQVHGPRHAAARLAMIAGMLDALANQQAMDGDGDPRTRH